MIRSWTFLWPSHELVSRVECIAQFNIRLWTRGVQIRTDTVLSFFEYS